MSPKGSFNAQEAQPNDIIAYITVNNTAIIFATSEMSLLVYV